MSPQSKNGPARQRAAAKDKKPYERVPSADSSSAETEQTDSLGRASSGSSSDSSTILLTYPADLPKVETPRQIHEAPILVHDDVPGFPTYEQYKHIEDVYMASLSGRKQFKALISQELFDQIWDVLNGSPKLIGTAQFRFWVRKMFTLTYPQTNMSPRPEDAPVPQLMIMHDSRPVAIKEQLYEVLCYCHALSGHGGRDKTCAVIRGQYSWIPKELIAQFVKACPTCTLKRSGNPELVALVRNHVSRGAQITDGRSYSQEDVPYVALPYYGPGPNDSGRDYSAVPSTNRPLSLLFSPPVVGSPQTAYVGDSLSDDSGSPVLSSDSDGNVDFSVSYEHGSPLSYRLLRQASGDDDAPRGWTPPSGFSPARLLGFSGSGSRCGAYNSIRGSPRSIPPVRSQSLAEESVFTRMRNPPTLAKYPSDGDASLDFDHAAASLRAQHPQIDPALLMEEYAQRSPSLRPAYDARLTPLNLAFQKTVDGLLGGGGYLASAASSAMPTPTSAGTYASAATSDAESPLTPDHEADGTLVSKASALSLHDRRVGEQPEEEHGWDVAEAWLNPEYHVGKGYEESEGMSVDGEQDITEARRSE